jgi:hypothetical protein
MICLPTGGRNFINNFEAYEKRKGQAQACPFSSAFEQLYFINGVGIGMTGLP